MVSPLQPRDTGLLLVDVQQRLCAAMPEAALHQALRSWTILVEMAARLRLPVVVSEQYPKGLGATVPLLREALGKVTPPPRFVEKTRFSCVGVPEFDQLLAVAARSTWLVAGLEAHVCVLQTARDLLERGHRVHLITDACLSRSDDNRRIGLELAARCGATLSSTETALFDLVKVGEGETFRALSRLVK